MLKFIENKSQNKILYNSSLHISYNTILLRRKSTLHISQIHNFYHIILYNTIYHHSIILKLIQIKFQKKSQHSPSVNTS